jgi:hypothetical protein
LGGVVRLMCSRFSVGAIFSLGVVAMADVVMVAVELEGWVEEGGE